jgi:hypothetical protein
VRSEVGVEFTDVVKNRFSVRRYEDTKAVPEPPTAELPYPLEDILL